MGFRINTNVAAMSAHASSIANNRAIDSSLSKLNSGFRINSAGDDASGLAIADSLRSQANSLGQAIMNANDAIGIIQTADKAMDEQIKILDTIKTKAVQAAQDGQTTETRRSLQADISRLMEELDNIGNTTSFNGQNLLSGSFSNKEFQIGAYSNQTVKASIGATTSDKIGLTRFETGHNVRSADLAGLAANDGKVTVTFRNVDGINDITLEPVKLADVGAGGEVGIKAGMGLGALAEAINRNSDKTGVKASVTVESVFEQPITAGKTTEDFTINGVRIGAIEVKDKDGNGALRAAINSVKDQTGVEASVDSKGRLVLNNRDGRGIKVTDGAFGSPSEKLTTKAAAAGAAIPAGGTVSGTFGGAGMDTDLTAAQGLNITQATTANAANTDSYNSLKKKLDGSGQFDIISKTAEQTALTAMANHINNTDKGLDGALGLTFDTGLTGATAANANVQLAAVNASTTIDDLKTNLDALRKNLVEQKEALNKDELGTVFSNAAGGTAAQTAARAALGFDDAIAQVDGWIKAANSGLDGLDSIINITNDNNVNMGRLSLVANNGKDIQIEAKAGATDVTSAIGYDKGVSEKTVSLRETNAKIETDVADAMGFNSEDWQNDPAKSDNKNGYAAGVMTLKGAMAMMNIAETAQKALDAIRSDLGSVQNQLISTVNNISVTQVNVKAAESNIRDVDFAQESATFSKHQILAQSGVYAMSQANAVQQNVMRLLQ